MEWNVASNLPSLALTWRPASGPADFKVGIKSSQRLAIVSLNLDSQLVFLVSQIPRHTHGRGDTAHPL
jgi:hypothetical protein